MAYDLLMTAAVADELQALEGGRIQRVIQVAPLALGLEVYAHGVRHQLLLSADPQGARVHRVPEKLTRDPQAQTPFLLRARRFLLDGFLLKVEQIPWERILTFTVRSAEGVEVRLVAEIMGRHSNLILLDAGGRILEAIKHVTPQMSRVRPILPGRTYAPPPVPQAPTPLELSPEALGEALAGIEPPLDRALPRRLRGVSPLAAREALFRAGLDPRQPLPEGGIPALGEALQDLYGLLERRRWAPTVAWLDDVPQAFAPYPLTHLEAQGARLEAVEAPSWAVHAYFARRQAVTGHRQRAEALRRRLAEAMDRLRARIEALEGELARGEEAERWRTWGEWIYACLADIPPHAVEFTAPDGTRIPLDPRLSAVENAQRYFRRYEKARGALQQVPERLREARERLAYLEELDFHLSQARGFQEVEALAREVAAALGEERDRKKRKKKGERTTGLFRRVPLGEFVAYVGRSAEGNRYVTFQLGGPDDLWFHARGVPGAHVILKTGGQEPPQEVVRRAAALAARHSAAGPGPVLVDVTRRRYVRPLKGGPGLVSYRNEETIWVDPEEAPDPAPRGG